VRLLPSAASATSLRMSALAGPDPIGMDLGDFSMAAGKEPTGSVNAGMDMVYDYLSVHMKCILQSLCWFCLH
jgi:hypothetical protein